MRRVNDLSGDCCLWGINAQEESILGVKLVGWKIQEEKVLGGKNSGERWGPALENCNTSISKVDSNFDSSKIVTMYQVQKSSNMKDPILILS